jgi:hypothetical protein
MNKANINKVDGNDFTFFYTLLFSHLSDINRNKNSDLSHI